MPKPRTIYFVCTGNTCRSPMAEALFRAELKRVGLDSTFSVASFGLAATPGRPAALHSQEIVKSFDADLSTHRSGRAADFDLNRDDIFIGMAFEHLHALKTLPAQSFCIGEFFPENEPSREVADPFGGTFEDYRVTCDLISSAFPRLIQFLKTLD